MERGKLLVLRFARVWVGVVGMEKTSTAADKRARGRRTRACKASRTLFLVFQCHSLSMVQYKVHVELRNSERLHRDYPIYKHVS